MKKIIFFIAAIAVATTAHANIVAVPKCYDMATNRLEAVAQADLANSQVHHAVLRQIEKTQDCFREFYPNTVDSLAMAASMIREMADNEKYGPHWTTALNDAIVHIAAARANLKSEFRCAAWVLEACPNVSGTEVDRPRETAGPHKVSRSR